MRSVAKGAISRFTTAAEGAKTPFRPEQVAAAEAAQWNAARDASAQVRVVAGPGTGKSSTVEKRVRWLVAEQGIPGERIFVVSFTRAAARDLSRRVHTYCANNGVASDAVRVSTLHSLALLVLRRAGLLTAYPVAPMVLDEWELKNIFDAEYANASRRPPGRCAEIRRDHEAFWSTGAHDPPNFIPPDPPISDIERDSFRAFHSPQTQVYACVLPGEIIRKCVEGIAAGILDPVELLGIEQLIVDEFQDLNPCDLAFVDHLIRHGVTTFVSGDDDQSIYSFRFASPHGIQLFDRDYPGAGDHNLVDCFRCTPAVLAGATTLMAAHPLPDRIPKHLRSLYEASDPPQTGVLHRLRFASGRAEARAVAASCQALIRSGIPPREILILISDRRALATELTNAFEEIGLDHDPPHPAAYVDTDHGRLALAILRIVSEPNDYVAHRIVLGQARGVGAGTCNAIANAVVANNLNYRSLFYDPLPAELFRGRQKTALESARALVARVVGWEPSDELATHDAEIRQMLEDRSGAEARDSWIENASHLPPDLTLGEVRDYLWADTDEQQLDVLRTAFQRLGLELIEDDVLLPRARMMTMHRAKGLSAQVVFIPGLEEEIFPGERRRPYPGLVLEAARLLYVSVSRARGASIVSYAGTRTRFGILTRPAPSRFTASLGGAFGYRDDQGLLPAEVQVIVGECASL